MRIGSIELLPLSDGTAKLPLDFYVNLDFTRHPELVAGEGWCTSRWAASCCAAADAPR